MGAAVRLDARVDPLVGLEVGGGPELGRAHRAGEELLVGVDLHVVPQPARPFELGPADGALVRLLVRVDPAVPLEVAVLEEGLAARLAHVGPVLGLLPRLDDAVDALVALQRDLRDKRQAAQRAPVRGFPYQRKLWISRVVTFNSVQV